jgi:hypothetical protein
MGPSAGDAEILELYVSLGSVGGDDLTLRMSPVIVRQVLALLDEQGLEHGRVLERSANAELWVEAVKVLGAAGGGLVALTTVITTIIKRHDGKRVLIERPGGAKTELEGYSEKEVERFLHQRVEDQKARDAEVERMFRGEQESE